MIKPLSEMTGKELDREGRKHSLERKRYFFGIFEEFDEAYRLRILEKIKEEKEKEE